MKLICTNKLSGCTGITIGYLYESDDSFVDFGDDTYRLRLNDDGRTGQYYTQSQFEVVPKQSHPTEPPKDYKTLIEQIKGGN